MRKWITKKQAAEIAGVSQRTIDRWIKEGTLTKYKTGVNSLRVWLDLNEVKGLFIEADPSEVTNEQ